MTTHAQQQSLIAEGQPLVHSLAAVVWRRLPVRVDLDDLIAYGQVGLAEAAVQYDSSRGPQFTTYAYYRVKGAMYDGVSKMSWTSRGRLNRMRQKSQAAWEAANAAPHDEPAAAEPASAFTGSHRIARVILSSQYDPGSAGPDSAAVEDPADTPVMLLANREILQRLNLLIKTRPHLQRVIIESVYYEGLTLQSAAKRLGISKSWASRLHSQALEYLAVKLRKIGGD